MTKPNPEKKKVIQDNQSCAITIGNFFFDECPPLIRNNDCIYYYNDEEKIYQPFDKDVFHVHLRKFGRKYSAFKVWKSSRMNEIFSYLSADPHIKSVTLDAYPNLLCLNNGIFDLSKRTLLGHSHNYYFSTKINLDYDPTATECPNLQNYLATTFDNNSKQIDLVLEMCGYILHPSCKSEVLFLLDGQGGSGKSTLINTIKLFFSEDQITALSIHDLASGGFNSELLLNSRINLCGESKKSYLEAEEIKKIVSQDDIVIQRKYKKPLNFTPKTKIIVACNGLPRFKDTSEGIFRRVIIINFNKQFRSKHQLDRLSAASPEGIEIADNSIFEKISSEKTAIFNYFLTGLTALQERQWFFEDTSQSLESLHAYRRDCDPIREFLEDNYALPTKEQTQNDKGFSSIMNMYEHYKRWYEENIQSGGSFKLRSHELGKRVKEVFNIEQLSERKSLYDLTLQRAVRRTVYPVVPKIDEDNPLLDSATPPPQSTLNI